MLSPGGGAGNKAAAVQKIKTAADVIVLAMNAFEVGSKEQQALMRAAQALSGIVGKSTGTNMVPADITAMAQAAQKGPPSGAPPPGVMPGGPPPGAGAEPPPMAA